MLIMRRLIVGNGSNNALTGYLWKFVVEYKIDCGHFFQKNT